MQITEDQFRFEWFSGTGKGGQHRNLDSMITARAQATR